MDYYMIFLRFVHIFCAVFWAGAVMFIAYFVSPAVKSLGPEGGKFMQSIASTNKYPIVMNLAAILAILSGALMFWRVSGGFNHDWLATGYGLFLSIGSVAALIAYIFGFTTQRPAAMRMVAIGKEIREQGGPPNEDQMKEIGVLQRKLSGGMRIIAIFLIISIITMALARYVMW